MNTNTAICNVLVLLTLILVGATGLAAQASPFKYGVEYLCNKDQATERVVVRYCRRDSDRPGERTVDVDNFCHVEYLDRPTKIPTISFFAAELYSDIAAKLQVCKDPATGKPPGVGTPTTAGLSADTSITKALAAKVDINIVGMRFGDPVRLANCPLLQLGPPKQNCYMPFVDLVSELAADFGTGDMAAKDVKIVQLTSSNCPSWVWECTAYITIHDGKLDGVSLFTNGRNAAGAVTRDLTAKYGKPTRMKAGTVTPDTGNKFSISEPEWDLPGLRVRYEIVSRNEDNDDRIKTNEGIVRILTETENQRRLNKQKEPVKTRL